MLRSLSERSDLLQTLLWVTPNTSFMVTKGFFTCLLPVIGNGKSNSHFNTILITFVYCIKHPRDQDQDLLYNNPYYLFDTNEHLFQRLECLECF